MNGMDSRNGRDSLPMRAHPLATAVALALAGVLTGCASHAPGPDASPVERARAAYAEQNYGDAAHLLTEPAEKGDPAAQYALGYLYYYGQGVPRDLYRAQRWFETSASLGNFEAKRALVTLRTYGKLPREVKQSPAPAQPPVAAAPEAPVTAAEPAETAVAPEAPVAAAKPAEAAAVPVAPIPEAPAEAANAPVEAKQEQAVAAPVIAPEAPASDAAPAPVAAAPKAVEETAPVAEAPAPAPAPVQVQPAPVHTPTPAAPVAPRSESATARNGVAVAAPVAAARAPSVPSPRGECSPAQAAAPKAPAQPDAGSATAKAPASSAPAPGDDPGDLPDSPVVIMGKEEVTQPAGPRSVALRRPATAPVTLVPGSEQAAPIRHKAPAPVSVGKGKHRYTIHLLSSPRKEELLHTVRTLALAGAAWYPVHQGGAVQYRLIYGGYDTYAEAKAALHSLPEPLFAKDPWINNYPANVTVTAFNGIPTARIAAVEPAILR